MEFRRREKYAMEDLIEIVRILRGPEGCPWDREQDHHSIRKNLIEETYEAAEAIDLEDSVLLHEELGDILLQVALHARMEQEAGRFDFNDVCDGICKKLIERHPHVFGDTQVKGTDEVLYNWEKIKQNSKGQTTAAQTLRSVPGTLPALMRAQKVQQREGKAGLPAVETEQALAALREQIDALEASGKEAAKEHAGSVLFAAVRLSQSLGEDAEEALSSATGEEIARFERAEAKLLEAGKTVAGCTADEWDACWLAAKRD